jgi:hypothetical protein
MDLEHDVLQLVKLLGSFVLTQKCRCDLAAEFV